MKGSGMEEAIATIMLPERVDSATSASVEALMVGALRPNASVIVDGSGVTYMSAAGVRALAIVLHRADELSARIVFCSFSGPAADCLLVSGFSQLFDVADSTEQALSRLRPKLAEGPADRLHP
ncbi:MAG: STAS domain-containing protein [Reyranella sp.]|nr:STAS domain-containing protein [Reyranella sp.]MDP3162612.1 STAS domain-containing protein [Reyranella sp.]